MSVYDRLKALNISLPVVEPPVAAFVPVVRTGNLAFVSGHIAKENWKPWGGRLGEIVAPPRLIAPMPNYDLWMWAFRDSEGNIPQLMSEVPHAA
jgi:hypothetical protein